MWGRIERLALSDGDWESAITSKKAAIKLLGDEKAQLYEWQALLEQFESEEPYRLTQTGE